MTHVYIGTYTDGASDGIYRARLNGESGALCELTLVAALTNPTFVALHPTKRFLYAVHDLPDDTVVEQGGQVCPTGAVSAYAIDAASGELAYLNTQSSQGVTPCHVAVDGAGRYAFVANFRGAQGGCAAMLPIGGDGCLEPASGFVQHRGASAHPTRQAGPHAHSVTLDPAQRYAFVADLGIDKVMAYRIDWDAGTMVANVAPSATLAAGSGPRHMAFHPNGRWAYLINEIGNTMTAFSYEAESGHLVAAQTISTLPAGWQGRSSCADVHVHSSGRFLYGSNRGHDSIVCYAIDETSGELTLIGHVPSGGSEPRNFLLDPQGRFVWVANQKSDNVVTYAIDQATGLLAVTGHVLETPTPVCLVLR